MRKLLKIVIIVGLIGSLLIGCNKEGTDETPAPGNEKSPVQSEPTNQEPKEVEPVSPSDINKPVTFQKAFPDVIFGSPTEYLQQLIPGFEIGLSKTQTEKILGKPNLVNISQYEWGEKHDWTYEDVKGYQLTTTFDKEGYLVNFQLKKYLPGKGLIPKLINKITPSRGESVNYTELGFEEVLLGTTVDEVLNRFGEPISGYISYDEMYGYNLALVYQGLTLHILLENDNPYVQFIETNDLGSVDTYRGIQVGSAVEDVVEMYGKPAYDWKETGDLIYATEDFWFAIKFIIENEKVTSISIYEAS